MLLGLILAAVGIGLVAGVVLGSLVTYLLTRKLLRDRMENLKQGQQITQAEKNRLETYIANSDDISELDLSNTEEKLEVVTLDGKVIDGYKDTVENIDRNLQSQMRGKRIMKIKT
jgi:Na+/glutamate symporter